MTGSRRALTALGLALAAAAVALGLSWAGAFDRLEAQSVDARFDLRGPQPARDVAVVAVDAKTFSDLHRQWPFPRSLHGRVIDRLRRAGARQISYDVQFTEPTTAREDGALFDAVARTPHAVLSTTETDARGGTAVLGGDAALRSIGARAAHTATPREADGVVRRMPPRRIEGLISFAAASAQGARGRPVDPEAFGGDPYIDFQGPPGTIDTLSYSDVLRGRFDPSLVRGRVVVVGASAPSLQDLHPTAVSGDRLMPGPEVLANATSTALRGFPLRPAPAALTVAAALLLAALAAFAGLRLPILAAVGATVAGGALYAGAAVLAFDAGRVVDLVAPIAALLLAATAALGMRVTLEARERRRTRDLFGRFVPDEIVQEILKAPGGPRRLAGRRQEATVLFSDLRGFTGFAESQPAEAVLEVLDRYLSSMSDAVLDNGGTVVSYMGDGIMAVFGAPVPREDHAVAAYAAAREMVGERLHGFNAWLAERDMPAFRMGVGLNSGPVMSGTVGSERRLEYAAIGDTTNVAARLEAMTKETGGGLFVAGSTVALLGEKAVDLRPGGSMEVRGRSEHLEVWQLPGAGAADPVST